jgi:predicted CXXCH cytochrome family protein
MEVILLLVAAAATGVLLQRVRPPGAGLVAGGCLLLAGAGLWIPRPAPDPALRDALPGRIEAGEYTRSESCRACHPGAYEAWHASYHRTMTQAARPDTVLADFARVTLEDRGHETRLERVGDRFWAELPDPLWFTDPSPDKPPTPPRIRARVVMTTGSHHLQNYWIRRPASGPVYRESYDNGALVQLPFVWLIDEARWIPAQDSFLTPPSDSLEPPLVWNTSCHVCPSVAPEPGFRDGAFETRTVELGIACEACHGPARAHVEKNHSPLRRYLAYLGDGPDDSIVQPARLDRDRSAEACGQCHSFGAILDLEGWQRRGLGYRPGEPLATKKALLRYEDPPRSPELLAHLVHEPNALDGRYWPDGTIRVAGRELNGLVESACFERGDLTCVSCHSMHAYREPADQLVETPMDAVCLDCHGANAYDVASHTRHPRDSAGSRCVNCHMPHTTYGLFVAMRSHRIDSPSAESSLRSGRPNACNLCHLDRGLAWTAKYLAEWYGAETPSQESPDVPAGALWALSGDAAQRAVAAWHLGWPPAQQATREGFAAPILATLLADPYAAVRRVAANALAGEPGFESLGFDFVAPERERLRARDEALRRARRDDTIDWDLIGRLLAARDERPLRIIE